MKRIGHYIYILPFKDGRFFKFGISSNSLDRVKMHDKNYGIDIKCSKIYEFKTRKHIRCVERFLDLILPTFKDNPYQGNDGYTEIREMDYLENCFNELDTFADKFDGKIFDLKPIYNKVVGEKERVVKYRRKKAYLLDDPECRKNDIEYLLDFFRDKNILEISYEDDVKICFKIDSLDKPDFDKLRLSYHVEHPIKYEEDAILTSGLMFANGYKDRGYTEYMFYKNYLSNGGHCHYSIESGMYSTFIYSYIKKLY